MPKRNQTHERNWVREQNPTYERNQMQVLERKAVEHGDDPKGHEGVQGSKDHDSRNGLQTGSQSSLHEGSRNHRICHLSRRSRSNRDTGDHDLQTKIGGALERHRNGNQRSLTLSDKVIDLLRLSALSERFGFGLAKKTEDHYRNILFGLNDPRGQSTVEFAVVMAGCLLVVVVLGMLSTAIQNDLFVEHAVFSASHNVSGAIGAIVDVFVY